MHTPTPAQAAAATLVDAVTTADPGLLRAATATRVEATLGALIIHAGPRTSSARSAWTTPAALTIGRPGSPAPPGSSPAAQRAVRHLQRLDACLLTLADALGLDADTPPSQRPAAARRL